MKEEESQIGDFINSFTSCVVHPLCQFAICILSMFIIPYYDGTTTNGDAHSARILMGPAT